MAKKAAAIQTAVDTGQKANACAGIIDFLALVQAQTGKKKPKLTQYQSTLLTNDAQRLAAALDC